MPSFARRLWKWTAALLAAVLILLAIGVGLFRFAVPLVPGLRADAEAMAERALGWPVHIGELDLRWAVLGPELVLLDVQLLAPATHQPLVSATQLDIVFGPLDIFQEGVIRPSHIRLHQPTLAVERDANGKLFLSGFALPAAGGSRVEWRELLDLGLRHGRLTILDGELHYRDAARDIRDWTLHLTDITLASDGERHELEGSLKPPGALGESIALGFAASGPPATPESWRWDLGVEVNELRLEEWYRQLGWLPAQVTRGTLNLAGKLSGQGLAELTGEGTLAAAQLDATVLSPVAMAPGAARAVQRVDLQWKAQLSGERFDLALSNIAIEGGAERHRDGSLAVRVGGADFPLEIAAARLPLAPVSGLVRFLPATGNESIGRLRDTVQQLAPRGELRELVLGLDAAAEPVRFSVQGEFRDIGIDPLERVPGVSGLSGRVQGDERSGDLWLDSENVELDFGALFRSSLPAAVLAAHLAWQSGDTGWTVSGRDIVVRNPEATATATLSLVLPREGAPSIDLAAVARDVDLHARSRWLPVGVMSERLVHWLDTAILAGRVPEATLTLRGPLGSFPYRDGSGVFDVRFMLEDAAIAYAPDWPAVEDLRAAVHFNGPALDVQVVAGRLQENLVVTDGLARFADLREAELAVTAQASGDMRMAWQFLAASPLREPLAGTLNALDAEGPFKADITLDIPLKDVQATTLAVTAALDRIRVRATALPWTVTDLAGTLRVTEQAVTAGPLVGELVGAPFTASVTAGKPGKAGGFSSTHVAMQGRMPVTAFEAYLPPAWLARLDGELDWNGELHIPGGGAPLEFDIESPLADVTSTLPAPLDALHPASAQITLPGGHIDAAVHMPTLGRARLRFAETPAGWRFERGRVRLGAAEPPGLPAEPGLLVEGETPVLDARGWLTLDAADRIAGSDPAGAAVQGAPDQLLRGFDLAAGTLLVGDVVLEAQSVRGVRLPPAATPDAGVEPGWELTLAGPATGRIRTLPAEGSVARWEVALERLHLPDGEGEPAAPDDEDAASAPPDPRELPGLLLDIGDLRIGPMQLGHVTGNLQRTAIGYTTEDLRARAPGFFIELDGRWEVVKDEHYTSMSSVLVSDDLGEALQRLGYATGGIDADEARIEANLAWHAAPMRMDYGLLEGTLGFSAADGSLREVNPGAGRLIGLLSIAALPRRLMLDFSDFFGEGLHFDTMQGDFLVTGGNAYTTNARLQGPSVSVLLVGRAGLVARDYDQLAIVDPDVSASIPVAGYLAAGPTVGAALLLLSQLLKAPLSDITQVKYRITGSWDDPLVERVPQASNEPKTVPPADR